MMTVMRCSPVHGISFISERIESQAKILGQLLKTVLKQQTSDIGSAIWRLGLNALFNKDYCDTLVGLQQLSN